VPGGCFDLYDDSDGDGVFDDAVDLFRTRGCDGGIFQRGDGVTTFGAWEPGAYLVVDSSPPVGFRRAAPLAVTIAAGANVATVFHESPGVLVTTYGADTGADPLPGACYDIYTADADGVPVDYAASACDWDDGQSDGTTRSYVAPGAHVLVKSNNWSPPDGYLPTVNRPFAVAEGAVTEFDITLALVPPSTRRFGALTWDSPAFDRCNPTGQSHFYAAFTFELSGQTRIDLRATDSDSGAPILDDPYLCLYRGGFDPSAPDANLAGFDDNGGEWSDSQIAASLEPGTYVIVATSGDGDQTGTFALEVTTQSSPTPSPSPSPPGSATRRFYLSGDAQSLATYPIDDYVIISLNGVEAYRSGAVVRAPEPFAFDAAPGDTVRLVGMDVGGIYFLGPVHLVRAQDQAVLHTATIPGRTSVPGVDIFYDMTCTITADFGATCVVAVGNETPPVLTAPSDQTSDEGT